MSYGPNRGELWFRLTLSVAGLCLICVALVVRGIPDGPALVEVIGVAGLFFGGSALSAAIRLWQRRGE